MHVCVQAITRRSSCIEEQRPAGQTATCRNEAGRLLVVHPARLRSVGEGAVAAVRGGGLVGGDGVDVLDEEVDVSLRAHQPRALVAADGAAELLRRVRYSFHSLHITGVLVLL